MEHRSKKTATITLRVSPAVKAAAEIAAEREHRSLTSFIEVLILERCEMLEKIRRSQELR
jgi:hypothetical protein